MRFVACVFGPNSQSLTCFCCDTRHASAEADCCSPAECGHIFLGLTGAHAGRILKGEKSGDLLLQQETTVEMIVNLKTARAFGVTAPLVLLTAFFLNIMRCRRSLRP
jgi:hypothetical protein